MNIRFTIHQCCIVKFKFTMQCCNMNIKFTIQFCNSVSGGVASRNHAARDHGEAHHGDSRQSSHPHDKESAVF